MNGWTAAGTALLLCGVAPAAYGAATGPVRRRVPAQNLVTTLLSLVILLLAQGFGRPAYVDPALVLAVLGPAGTLLYVRLLADRLADRPPRPRTAAHGHGAHLRRGSRGGAAAVRGRRDPAERW